MNTTKIQTWKNTVITTILLVLVVIFPLIVDNAYFNILETKYKAYYMIMLMLITISIVLSFWQEKIGLLQIVKENKIILIFWSILIISTLQSDYLYEAFWGNEGRYSGLFLLSIYIISYLIIKSSWKFNPWVLEFFLGTGLVMCVIGISDYFWMDILGYHQNMKADQIVSYVSTVGNINSYTAYIALLIGLSTTLFCTSTSKVKTTWYYINIVIAFFAIIMGRSDNAYLALAALFGFLPFYAFQNKRGTLRYLITLASFFTVIQCISWINVIYEDGVVGLESLFNVIASFQGLIFVVIGLWLVCIGYWYVTMKKTAKVETENKKLIWVWLAIVSIAIIGIVVAWIDANLGGNGARYGALEPYLVFSDSWGTNRGFIWKKSIEMYQEFSPIRKLIGYGPDTFGILTVNNIMKDMVNTTGQIFDTAHNEYIQYLLTIGAFGLVIYLTFLVTTGFTMIKKRSHSPYIMGCFFAILCYSAQALVNLNLPITTPMMWLLLSAAMSACKSES